MADHDGMTPNLAARARARLGNALRPRVQVTAPPPGVQVDWNVPVMVRDGTTLRVNVSRPADGLPAPAIMSAHPYDKDKIGAKTRSGRGVNWQSRLFPQPNPVRISAWTSWEAPDPAFWVPRGYVVINADLRGGGSAEGTDALLSDAEAQDHYDLIEWVGSQAWCTGKVGLDGVSYLAISQYKVAALHPPHLAAICPWEGLSDLYRDFARPGGVREDGFSIVWSNATRHSARVEGNLRKDIVARLERDEWYESMTPRLEEIEVPALICGSFSDHSLHSRGSFEVFRRAGSTRRWLYTHRDGKWSHYYSDIAAATRARFFDHVLKGEDNGWDDQPRVRLAVYEAGPTPAEVVDEATWPPADLTWSELFLDAGGGGLVPQAPDRATTTAAHTRRGRASFSWTVPHDLDVIGHAAVRLYVEARACDDVHLFVGLRKPREGCEVVFEGSFGFAYDMVSKRVAARRPLRARLNPVHASATGTHPSPSPAVDPRPDRSRRGRIAPARDPVPRGRDPAARRPRPLVLPPGPRARPIADRLPGRAQGDLRPAHRC